MERFRTVQFEMLGNIDRVCRENGLPYILSAYTARAAALDHDLPSGISVPTLAMYYTDAMKLPALLPEYQWESALQNRMIPHTLLRCGDPNSFYMRADEVGCYSMHGLCVDIELIRPVPGKGVINRALVALEAACVMLARFRSMGGGWKKLFSLTVPVEKAALKWAYLGKLGKSKRIRISRFPKKSVEFAKTMLENRQETDVCGRSFFVPAELEKYLLTECGEKWTHMSAQKDMEDFHLAVMDEDTPWKNMQGMVEEIYGRGPAINWMKWYRMRGRSRKLRSKIRGYWEILFCTKDRFDFYRQLKPRKAEILALRKAEDVPGLRSVLQSYVDALRRHVKIGLTPCFDVDILECALYLMEKDGRGEEARRVRACIRPEHRKELKLEGFDHE